VKKSRKRKERANFLELRKGELRRTPLPRTPVNKAKRKDQSSGNSGPLTSGLPSAQQFAS
jgi:hypothetical protein